MKNLDKSAILSGLRIHKQAFYSRYGVKRMALFGSVARGDYRADSDIDVVVELEEPDLFALVHIKEDLEADFQRPVDVIPYSEFTHEALKRRIQNEALYV